MAGLQAPPERNVAHEHHTIRVCMGPGCTCCGSGRLLRTVAEQLNDAAPDALADGSLSVATCGCVGACTLGPVMMVDRRVHIAVDDRKLADVLGGLLGQLVEH